MAITSTLKPLKRCDGAVHNIKSLLQETHCLKPFACSLRVGVLGRGLRGNKLTTLPLSDFSLIKETALVSALRTQGKRCPAEPQCRQ